MRRGPSRKAWAPPCLGPQGAARFNLIGNIQPVREDSTRSEGVESSRSGATPHRQQACARVSSLTLHMLASTRPGRAALHPIRCAAPDPSRYTRSEEVQCLRIGCFASRNKSNRGHLLPTHPSGSIRRCQTTSKYPPGSEQEALHPLRRDTPVTSRYTRSEGV